MLPDVATQKVAGLAAKNARKATFLRLSFHRMFSNKVNKIRTGDFPTECQLRYLHHVLLLLFQFNVVQMVSLFI